MSYCHIHGHHEGDGCDACRIAEDQASSERQGILEELSDLRGTQGDLAFAINNPGNYKCPHCKLRTLLMGASRCPRCHGTVGAPFLENVRRREEEQRKIREDAQRNAEEVRRLREEAGRKESERLREQQLELEIIERKRQKAMRFTAIYFGYLLPTFYCATGLIVSRVFLGMKWEYGDIIGIIPILNWLVVLGGIFLGDTITKLYAIFWLIIGVALVFRVLSMPSKPAT